MLPKEMTSIRYFGLDSQEKTAISISLDDQMKKEQVEEVRKKVRRLNLHEGGAIELNIQASNCSVACPSSSILFYLLTHQSYPARKKLYLMNQIIRLVVHRDEEERMDDRYFSPEDRIDNIEANVKRLLREENKKLDVRKLDAIKSEIEFESSRLKDMEKDSSAWTAVQEDLREDSEGRDEVERQRIYRIEDDLRQVDEEMNNQPIVPQLGTLAELRQKWRTSKVLRVSVYVGVGLLVVIIIIVIVILAVTSKK